MLALLVGLNERVEGWVVGFELEPRAEERVLKFEVEPRAIGPVCGWQESECRSLGWETRCVPHLHGVAIPWQVKSPFPAHVQRMRSGAARV